MVGKVSFDLKNMTFSAEGDASFVLEQEAKFSDFQKRFCDRNLLCEDNALDVPLESKKTKGPEAEKNAPTAVTDSLCRLLNCSVQDLSKLVVMDESDSTIAIVVPKGTPFFKSISDEQFCFAMLHLAIFEAQGKKPTMAELTDACRNSHLRSMVHFSRNLSIGNKNYFVFVDKDKGATLLLTPNGRDFLQKIVLKVINGNVSKQE